ncbi:MAG: acyltransferase [Clostridia bacterium]|nr:acyltransferase [Clostridia bacterium]
MHQESAAERNSFHLIRFLLAVMVILTHCYTIDGTSTPLNRLTGGQLNEGTLAVDGFLVISGYLIVQSAHRSRNALVFLKKRALRIWPGLICALVFTALIIGGLAYDGTYAEYLRIRDGGPLSYIFHWLTLNLAAEPWNITGVFTGNLAHGVNVSLWTIKHEVSLYLLIAIFMVLHIHKKRPVYGVCYGIFLALHVLFTYFRIQLWDIRHVEAWVLNTWNYDHTTRTGMFFFAGALIGVYRDVLPLRWKYAGFGAALLVASGFAGMMRPVELLVWPYLLLCFAQSPRFDDFRRLGDLSYGLYVYSYPLQQLLSHVYPGIHPMLNFAITLSLIIPLAKVSWMLVEQPFVRIGRQKEHTA